MKAYGPVPSRRLGQSLGINHIPPKVCTYSCVYCQLGRTIKMQSERREFYPPEEILREVEEQIDKARERNERIDYLTFVADGEPTLDINLLSQRNPEVYPLLVEVGCDAFPFPHIDVVLPHGAASRTLDAVDDA